MITKKIFMTSGRERDLIRYSVGTDIKDAHVYSYEEAKEKLIAKNPAYKINADSFLKNVMENPYKDWIEY
jgi:hypothetical protein